MNAIEKIIKEAKSSIFVEVQKHGVQGMKRGVHSLRHGNAGHMIMEHNGSDIDHNTKHQAFYLDHMKPAQALIDHAKAAGFQPEKVESSVDSGVTATSTPENATKLVDHLHTKLIGDGYSKKTDGGSVHNYEHPDKEAVSVTHIGDGAVNVKGMDRPAWMKAKKAEGIIVKKWFE